MMKNEAGVRIEEMLCQLADATRIDGEIWRAAYTLEDKIAKNILREWIEDLGLEYREDAIGNVYGRLPGTEPGTILTGSHLDTVKNGGKYDGALGVVTGVAALGYLKQSGFVPKHSLEVGGLMEEEGSRFPSGCQGSRAICGTLKEEDLEELSRDGVTLREALVSAGYQTEALKNVKRDDIRAIVELHIEQGPTLDSSDEYRVGIVTGIRGNLRHKTIRCIGQTAHSGAVDKQFRHDAVLAFAELAYRMDCLWDEWLKAGHDLVFTIGVVHTAPTSAIAIVPGEVTFCSDIRSLSQETLDGFHALFEEEARKVGDKRGVKFEFDGVIKSQPLAIHKELSEHLAKSATEAGLKVKKLPSGAGHDTVIFGNLGIPAAMIFVANQKGSHNPNEAMEITDFIQGAEALWHAVKEFPTEGIR